jgi:hypothetical protein
MYNIEQAPTQESSNDKNGSLIAFSKDADHISREQGSFYESMDQESEMDKGDNMKKEFCDNYQNKLLEALRNETIYVKKIEIINNAKKETNNKLVELIVLINDISDHIMFDATKKEIL